MLAIYEEFYNVDPNDHTGIIKYVESNLMFLENKKHFTDYDDFYAFSLLISKYIIALENTGKYKQTIKYADKALKLFDENMEQFEIDINEYFIYWSVLVSKGRSHYDLDDYNNSIKVFERLVKRDPDNDNLIKWLEFSNSKKRNSINKYLYVSGAVFFLLYITLRSSSNGLLFLKLGYLLAIGGLINDYFGDKISKWMQK